MTAASVELHASKMLGVDSRGFTFCDPFGGIGMVASAFKRTGWRVTVADHLLFPHYYQRARLAGSAYPTFAALLGHLKLTSFAELESYIEALPELRGWLTEEYSKRRKFFTPMNAAKIEAAWSSIKYWRAQHLISDHEYAFLISSLVNSFDRVANTAGTYYAFLKGTTRRASHKFKFQLLAPVAGTFDADCRFQDAMETVAIGSFDVLYLDPPYSSRAYDRYYHLPQTIVTGEEADVVGLSGVPKRPPIRSKFESPRTAERALADLVDAARCSLLMVQYAEGGLIRLDRVRSILSVRGTVNETVVDTIRYTTQHRPRATQHSLFIVSDA